MTPDGAIHNLSRRTFLGTVATLTSLAQPRPRPVNLIYVFADQLRRFSCGYVGDEFARTPNIDRLARESLDVRNAVPSTPVCAPYRASLLTGKYQSSTGMVINELRLSPEHECFGHALSKGGYDTAYIGKWHLWANQLGHHEETQNGFVPPGRYRLGFDQYWAAYNFNHTYHDAPYFRDTPRREIHSSTNPIRRPEWPSSICAPAAASRGRSPCSCPGVRRTTRGTGPIVLPISRSSFAM